MSHKILANAEHIISNLKQAGEASYLWLRTYHADNSEHLLIFRQQDDSLRKIADIWLCEQEVEQLAAFLSATPGNLEYVLLFRWRMDHLKGAARSHALGHLSARQSYFLPDLSQLAAL